jgi:hypothetical protein
MTAIAPRAAVGSETTTDSPPVERLVAKDYGAKRALIHIENRRNFLDVSADIMEHVDTIFFGDPKTAAMKVLGG